MSDPSGGGAEPSLNPSVGLGVLHLFCRIVPGTDSEGLLAAIKQRARTGTKLSRRRSSATRPTSAS